MCRLFGLRARTSTSADTWLVGPAGSQRSLKALSARHPHGWGIATWNGGLPAVAKSISPAFTDAEFDRAARESNAACVVAHVRRVSVGGVGIENTHPFRHGRLVFAHNGTIAEYERLRGAVLEHTAAALRPQTLGTTDTEGCFGLFLTRLASRKALESPTLDDLADALAWTAFQIRALDPEIAAKHMMVFLASDGDSLVGLRTGERELCYATEPQAAGRGDAIERLLLASEPLDEASRWIALGEGDLVGADASLVLRRWNLADFSAARAA